MIDAVFTAIRTKLAATTGVTTLLSSASAIYRLEAGGTASFPYVVMAWQGGGDVNDTPNEMLDVRVSVKAVAETASQAGGLADAIRTALHNQELTWSGSWKHLTCQHDNPLAFTEAVDRVTLWHMGAVYRVRASKR